MTLLRESGYWWIQRFLIDICSRQRGTVWNIYSGSVPSVAFHSHSHSTPSCSIRILEGSSLAQGFDQLCFHGSLRFLWQTPAERRALPAHSVQPSSRWEPNEWYFLPSFFLNLIRERDWEVRPELFQKDWEYTSSEALQIFDAGGLIDTRLVFIYKIKCGISWFAVLWISTGV